MTRRDRKRQMDGGKKKHAHTTPRTIPEHSAHRFRERERERVTSVVRELKKETDGGENRRKGGGREN